LLSSVVVFRRLSSFSSTFVRYGIFWARTWNEISPSEEFNITWPSKTNANLIDHQVRYEGFKVEPSLKWNSPVQGRSPLSDIFILLTPIKWCRRTLDEFGQVAVLLRGERPLFDVVALECHLKGLKLS
jgi:hypothetical protein